MYSLREHSPFISNIDFSKKHLDFPFLIDYNESGKRLPIKALLLLSTQAKLFLDKFSIAKKQKEVSMKHYELWYTKEAPFGQEDFHLFRHGRRSPDDGWEKWSLPLGNGYMGINVFGRTETERLQITENSLENPIAFNISGISIDNGMK